MEDFIRLNLQYFLGTGFAWLTLMGITLFIKSKTKDEPNVSIIMNNFMVIISLLFVIAIAYKLIFQVSVNNIPRSEIDRSYIEQNKNRYQYEVQQKGK
jgi:hypothetical protein